MKSIGHQIAGFQFGMAWAAFFARHGHGYSAREGWFSILMGCAILIVLEASAAPKGGAR